MKYLGHDFVEIAGIKWATMNIGANSITDSGLYFQWGDTQGYTATQAGTSSGQKAFKWDDYKYGDGTLSPGASGMTKYNSTDGKTVLDISDDAAQANWGGSWRMPTTNEIQALGAATTSAWTTDYQGSGVKGLVLTDKIDSSKALFFPAAGQCSAGSSRYVNTMVYYWTSSLDTDSVNKAYELYSSTNTVNFNRKDVRSCGFPVRGVFTGNIPEQEDLIDEELNYSSNTATIYQENQYTLPVLTNTHNLELTFSSSNTNVATINSSGIVSIVGNGNTTISAIFAGNEEYNEKTISYSLTVDIKKYLDYEGLSFYHSQIIEELNKKTTYVPTLNQAPTSSTLSYTKDGKSYNFAVGNFCRVEDSEDTYIFYQLYDLNNGVATWIKLTDDVLNWITLDSQGNIVDYQRTVGSESLSDTDAIMDIYKQAIIGNLGNKTEAIPAVYEAVTDGTTLNEGDTYYTSSTGEGEFISDGTEVADGTNYYVLVSAAVPAVPYDIKGYVDDGLATRAEDTVFGPSGTNHSKGLVPDPGATEGTTKYLREDGTWQTPPNTTYSSKEAANNGTDVSLVTTGEKYIWNNKQNALTFDTTPTPNSTNPVTSAGIKTAMSGLDEKIKFLHEQLLIPDADRVIMTTETNPEVLAICHEQGWCADSGYMTYGEAQAVTDIGTVFKDNTDITHFEELQYFAITAFADNALSGCINLTKIGLPPTLTTYGIGVFLNTNRINEVYIRDITKFCEESIGTDNWGWDSCPGRVYQNTRLFLNGMLVTDLVIPEGVSSIIYTFRNMRFNSVTLPKSLNTIGYRTFGGCVISDVIIKCDTITEFLERGINVDTYGDSDPRYMASRVFLNDTELTGSFNISSEVTKISVCALRSCKNITAITIPNTVTMINTGAFLDLRNITSLIIPNSASSNGGMIINGCTNLTMLDCGTIFNPFNDYNSAGYCRNLSVIKMRATTAPAIDIRQYNIGDLVQGTKYLYVPANSTGYDTGNWATLCSNLGFTLSKTL